MQVVHDVPVHALGVEDGCCVRYPEGGADGSGDHVLSGLCVLPVRELPPGVVVLAGIHLHAHPRRAQPRAQRPRLRRSPAGIPTASRRRCTSASEVLEVWK